MALVNDLKCGLLFVWGHSALLCSSSEQGSVFVLGKKLESLNDFSKVGTFPQFAANLRPFLVKNSMVWR